MNAKKRMAAAVLAAAAFALGACRAPSNEDLLEMNRSGKWKQAESTGMAMIKSPGALNQAAIHETYFNVAYAQARLGKKAEATATIAAYDRVAAGRQLPPRSLWVPKEMAKLKNELGLLSDTRQNLLKAMEENGRKNYAAASYLCDLVIADAEASEVQKATAQFVAAVCAVRLRDAAEAEKRFAAFDALKPALPPDHQALREEAAARKGLADLKAAKD